jgi:hypothetical protein
MIRLSILLSVTVAAGISAFVLSSDRPSMQASVSELSPQPPASQPIVQPPSGDWGDAPNFAVAADRAISELHEGITVNEWTAHHPGGTKIDPASIGIGGECVILGEKATLEDGTHVARLVSFNPPQAPSPAVLPSMQGESLINETCTMSMVQVEVRVSDEAAGRAAQRTVNQQFDSTYGPSEDQGRGLAFRSNRDHQCLRFGTPSRIRHWQNKVWARGLCLGSPAILEAADIPRLTERR